MNSKSVTKNQDKEPKRRTKFAKDSKSVTMTPKSDDNDDNR